jgi:hypothetical protein
MGNKSDYEKLDSNPMRISSQISVSVDLIESMDDFIELLSNAAQKDTHVLIYIKELVSGFVSNSNTKTNSFENMDLIVETVLENLSNLMMIPKWYDERKLLDWYIDNIGLISKNTENAKILISIMPNNSEQFLWELYSKMAPINIIKLVADKVKLDTLNRDKETFLFQVPGRKDIASMTINHWERSINYMIEVISQIDNLPLNHISDSEVTFIMSVMKSLNFWTYTDYDLKWKLFNVLSKKGFKFMTNHRSILSYMITVYPDTIPYYYIMLRCKSFDPSEDCEWLQSIFINKSRYVSHNYIWSLFRRKDYISFLYKTYININYNWGIEYLEFISRCASYNNNKLINMLTYEDDNGNTVIHIMAKRHDKQLLFPIIGKFGSYLKLKENSDGMNYNSLYQNSKLDTSLV